MFGFDVFKKWFNCLDEKRKLEILGDIFEIENVSVYSFYRLDDKIIFHLYAENVFYQIIFCYEEKLGNKVKVEVNRGSRFVVYRIRMGYEFLENYEFCNQEFLKFMDREKN